MLQTITFGPFMPNYIYHTIKALPGTRRVTFPYLSVSEEINQLAPLMVVYGKEEARQLNCLVVETILLID